MQNHSSTNRIITIIVVITSVQKVIWQEAASPFCLVTPSMQQCTQKSRVDKLQSSPSKSAPSSGDLDPRLMHGFLEDPICQPHKRHLDQFSGFRTAHQCAQHTDRQTDTQTDTHTQTTPRAKSVAIGRIYALRGCDAA